MSYQNNRGFTLLEVLIVLVLISVIMSFSWLIVRKSSQSTIREARSVMVSYLVTARTEALYGRDSRTFGVRVETGRVELLSANPSATSSTILVIEHDDTAFRHIVIDTSIHEFWFSPYSGRTNSAGEVMLRDVRTEVTASIDIGYEGSIE